MADVDSSFPTEVLNTRVQGARMPGWPEINCQKLAQAMGVHPMHLGNVLTGRDGTTLKYIERIASTIGISAESVVGRIKAARIEEEQRVERAAERWMARQRNRKSKSQPQ